MSKRSVHLFLGLVAFLALSPSPAAAYLDQATASLLVQGAIALVIGAATATKLYWHRIRQQLFGVHEGDPGEQG